MPANISVELAYRSSVISIPGSGNDLTVRQRVRFAPPLPQSFIVNDLDYAVDITSLLSSGLPSAPKPFATADFDDCSGADDHNRSGWLPWAVAAFLAGLFLAGFKWIPGLAGHILEVALLLFAAYIIGCLTGCGCRQFAGGDTSHHGREGHGHGAH